LPILSSALPIFSCALPIFSFPKPILSFLYPEESFRRLIFSSQRPFSPKKQVGGRPRFSDFSRFIGAFLPRGMQDAFAP